MNTTDKTSSATKASTLRLLRRTASAAAVVAVVAAAIAAPITAPEPTPGSAPMVIAIARADCPPDCGPGGGGTPSGPPGGGTEFVPPSMPATPSYEPGRGQPPLDQSNGISIHNSAAPQPSQATQPSQAPVQNQDGSYSRAVNGEQQPVNYNNAPDNQQINNDWQRLSDQLNNPRDQSIPNDNDPNLDNDTYDESNQFDNIDTDASKCMASLNSAGELVFPADCRAQYAACQALDLFHDPFRQLTGHDPVNLSQSKTADVLNPHNPPRQVRGRSLDPDSVIQFARIKPVPGNGTVQTNLYIPTADVHNPFGTNGGAQNMGDNRGPDLWSLADQSRVTLLIDFEDGIIVARQNPSIEIDTATAKTGVPVVKFWQRANGGVVLDYYATDPFAPNVANMAPGVSGSIIVLPTGSKPRVLGMVTRYPSLEINQYLPNNTGQQVLSEPTQDSGPAAGIGEGLLAWQHRIGDASVPAVDPDVASRGILEAPCPAPR